MHHYLHPLLMPKSVALVGASERAGSLGRSVFENLLAGQFTGDIYAVNPGHRTRGYHSTGTVGVFGAAASAGKLLGFDYSDKIRFAVDR